MYIIIAVNSGKKDGMSVFTGAGVAIITPMKANGEVNYDKLGEFLDYQINNSTDAIIICGTTGEASTLTHEEHVETIRFAADYVKKRVPVIAGTGSNCTETAVWLSQEAQKAGVDGCLVVTPYYNKATQKGLIQRTVKNQRVRKEKKTVRIQMVVKSQKIRKKIPRIQRRVKNQRVQKERKISKIQRKILMLNQH